MKILEIKDLNTYYGNIHALKGVNLDVDADEIVTLIGSNGAGKTTALCSIMGTVPVSSGSIIFKGENIVHKKPSEIVRMGISISPEGREVFPELSVSDNLKLGAYAVSEKRAIQRQYDVVYELFPRLLERKKQQAGTLSGGEQQMLAIGRALMNSPQLLLLDEPSLGLAPNLVEMIFKLIRDINKSGVTVLLVEQNANMALRIANRGFVLETGRTIMTDTAEHLRKNDDVRKAYLGTA